MQKFVNYRQRCVFETSQFKIIEIMDRGELKWPSNITLNHFGVEIFYLPRARPTDMEVIRCWKMSELLVQLSKNVLENTDCFLWRDVCSQYNIEGWDIAHKLIFVTIAIIVLLRIS